jgi:preprotein translocase subunit SecG
MFTLLLVVQILVSISIITLVLLQQGKGADMGAGFGSGASGTVFGARGSGSFFTRATAILATVFFANCLLIASPLVLHVSRAAPESVVEHIQQQEAQQKAADQEQTGAALDRLKDAAPDLPEIAPAPAAESPVPETPAAGKPAANEPAAEKPAAADAAPKPAATPDKKKLEDLPE